MRTLGTNILSGVTLGRLKGSIWRPVGKAFLSVLNNVSHVLLMCLTWSSSWAKVLILVCSQYKEPCWIRSIPFNRTVFSVRKNKNIGIWPGSNPPFWIREWNPPVFRTQFQGWSPTNRYRSVECGLRSDPLIWSLVTSQPHRPKSGHLTRNGTFDPWQGSLWIH